MRSWKEHMLRNVGRMHWVWLLGGLLVIAAIAFWAFPQSSANEPSANGPHGLLTSSPAAAERLTVANNVSTKSSIPVKKKYKVTIRQPAGPPRVDLGILDSTGKPATAACSTCHTTRPTNYENRKPADLDEFHQNIGFSHGTVSCLSCHNPDDYDTLRLADGKKVEYTDVMTLCAQCHGPQTRDYNHGAHGGMNGHWDLSRGPRIRNNCVDCHDPHSPSFPAMKPTFKPRDRFLDSNAHAGESHP